MRFDTINTFKFSQIFLFFYLFQLKKCEQEKKEKMDKQAFLQNAILAGQETQKEKHIVESKNIKNSKDLQVYIRN